MLTKDHQEFLPLLLFTFLIFLIFYLFILLFLFYYFIFCFVCILILFPPCSTYFVRYQIHFMKEQRRDKKKKKDHKVIYRTDVLLGNFFPFIAAVHPKSSAFCFCKLLKVFLFKKRGKIFPCKS